MATHDIIINISANPLKEEQERQNINIEKQNETIKPNIGNMGVE